MGIRMLYFNTTFLKMCFVIQFLCVKRFLLEKIVPKGHELVINEPAIEMYYGLGHEWMLFCPLRPGMRPKLAFNLPVVEWCFKSASSYKLCTKRIIHLEYCRSTLPSPPPLLYSQCGPQRTIDCRELSFICCCS